jgi:anaerobic selenocysteine-containing dehydrogenase
MDRRRFIKLTAVSGATAALAACGHPENQIIRFIPDDEFVPGVATWKPSICPLCPAGCGLHVRVMDADVDVVRDGQRGVMRKAVAKKLEGLADHPVNRGALCARGQAAIQITYHPDRLRHPLKRTGARFTGEFQEISWEEAITDLTGRLDTLASEGRQQALGFLSPARRTHRDELVSLFLQRYGAPAPIRVALFDEEVLRRANFSSFGRSQLPTFDLAQTRFVISFGADFLGTWNSPVAQGAAYGAMRQGTPGQRGAFVQVESRMSQTGANADQWIATRPGTEGAFALALAHVIMKEGLAQAGAAGRAGELIPDWSAGLPNFAPAAIESATGVPAARIEGLARQFASRRPAVAIIGGPALAQTNALWQAKAVNALNALVGSVDVSGGLQFTPALPGTPPQQSAHARTLAQSGLVQSDSTPRFQVLLIDQANPVFLSPKATGVADALERVPFIASFSNFLDDTTALADLILPDHSFLESWVEAIPESGARVATVGVAGPVMRPLHNTRAMPDVLLDVSRRLARPLEPPLAWQQFDEMLRERLSQLPVAADVADPWTTAQQRGGWWPVDAGSKNDELRAKNDESRTQGAAARPDEVDPMAARFDGAPDAFPFHLLPYASTQFYDGSSAHLPWLQEMPDPMTSAMWSNWVEINPRVAERLQIANGDLIEVTSQHGAVRAPAVITPGLAPDVVAMPVGQGHESFTRYASNRGSNPIQILAPSFIAESPGGGTAPPLAALAWAATRVRITRVGEGDGELTLFAGSAEEHPHRRR